MPPELTAPCAHCDTQVVYTPPGSDGLTVGWHHKDGGLYMGRCKECGHTAAPIESRRFCPLCGGPWEDLHCATPDRRGDEALTESSSARRLDWVKGLASSLPIQIEED